MDAERLAMDLRLAIAQEIEDFAFINLKQRAEFLSWHTADPRSVKEMDGLSWRELTTRAVRKLMEEGKLS